MKTALLIIGTLAVLLGLLWIGQGLNFVKWPQSSFMINQIQWANYGGALSMAGSVSDRIRTTAVGVPGFMFLAHTRHENRSGSSHAKISIRFD